MSDLLLPGDAAPWFSAASLGGASDYCFDTVAGRPVLMLFPGSMAAPTAVAATALIAADRGLFDDANACFFGVSIDPADVAQGRIARDLPGIRWFLDHDLAVSRLYGAASADGDRLIYRPHWLLLDRALRVVQRFPLGEGKPALAALRSLCAEASDGLAPVLIAPRILEPALCRSLIALHDQGGGIDSGFMREVGGVTVRQVDHAHKRRSDHLIADAGLQDQLRVRIQRFLVPQIIRSFQWEPTRIERWLVACYDGEQGGGYFHAHRDNTTKGTAHRRFACTINLNADDYEGGDLVFPEFGSRRYRAPTGGAVVFSCSLLHEALPVTRGRRFAFLPFFYDEAGARLREENRGFVALEQGG